MLPLTADRNEIVASRSHTLPIDNYLEQMQKRTEIVSNYFNKKALQLPSAKESISSTLPHPALVDPSKLQKHNQHQPTIEVLTRTHHRSHPEIPSHSSTRFLAKAKNPSQSFLQKAHNFLSKGLRLQSIPSTLKAKIVTLFHHVLDKGWNTIWDTVLVHFYDRIFAKKLFEFDSKGAIKRDPKTGKPLYKLYETDERGRVVLDPETEKPEPNMYLGIRNNAESAKLFIGQFAVFSALKKSSEVMHTHLIQPLLGNALGIASWKLSYGMYARSAILATSKEGIDILSPQKLLSHIAKQHSLYFPKSPELNSLSHKITYEFLWDTYKPVWNLLEKQITLSQEELEKQKPLWLMRAKHAGRSILQATYSPLQAASTIPLTIGKNLKNLFSKQKEDSLNNISITDSSLSKEKKEALNTIKIDGIPLMVIHERIMILQAISKHILLDNVLISQPLNIGNKQFVSPLFMDVLLSEESKLLATQSSYNAHPLLSKPIERIFDAKAYVKNYTLFYHIMSQEEYLHNIIYPKVALKIVSLLPESVFEKLGTTKQKVEEAIYAGKIEETLHIFKKVQHAYHVLISTTALLVRIEEFSNTPSMNGNYRKLFDAIDAFLQVYQSIMDLAEIKKVPLSTWWKKETTTHNQQESLLLQSLSTLKSIKETEYHTHSLYGISDIRKTLLASKITKPAVESNSTLKQFLGTFSTIARNLQTLYRDWGLKEVLDELDRTGRTLSQLESGELAFIARRSMGPYLLGKGFAWVFDRYIDPILEKLLPSEPFSRQLVKDYLFQSKWNPRQMAVDMGTSLGKGFFGNKKSFIANISDGISGTASDFMLKQLGENSGGLANPEELFNVLGGGTGLDENSQKQLMTLLNENPSFLENPENIAHLQSFFSK